MNTKIAWVAVIVVLVLALAWYLTSANRAQAPQAVLEEVSTSTPTATEEPVGDDVYVALISLTDEGFAPQTVTVKQGETVRFVNNSSRGMWVGADEHPTHTEYDGTATREHCSDGQTLGGSFDMCRAAVAGEFWEYTFTKAGTFGYHNHVGASAVGTIVVR